MAIFKIVGILKTRGKTLHGVEFQLDTWKLLNSSGCPPWKALHQKWDPCTGRYTHGGWTVQWEQREPLPMNPSKHCREELHGSFTTYRYTHSFIWKNKTRLCDSYQIHKECQTIQTRSVHLLASDTLTHGSHREYKKQQLCPVLSNIIFTTFLCRLEPYGKPPPFTS